MTSRLPPSIASRLSLPLIAAPMFKVSSPALVIAACNAGVIGAIPTLNARPASQLVEWLAEIKAGLKPGAAPFAPNLIMRDKRLSDDVRAVIDAGAEIVITSVGSPAPVMGPLHEAGALVLCDVATLEHARKAIAAGVDGLILLAAGAGGHTGWMNPFAFVRAIRQFYDGVVVMAGGMIDGRALYAAQVLGCDLGYMGTRFIATAESFADEEYRGFLTESELDHIVTSGAFKGMPGNYLAKALAAQGWVPRRLEAHFPPPADGSPPNYPEGWMAGHTVSGVTGPTTVADLVAEIRAEYEAAKV
jgi:nitronate monooxygenase